MVAVFLVAFVVTIVGFVLRAPILLGVILGGVVGFAARRTTTMAAGLLAVWGGIASAYPAALALGVFAYLGENWVTPLTMIFAAALAGWLVARATSGST